MTVLSLAAAGCGSAAVSDVPPTKAPSPTAPPTVGIGSTPMPDVTPTPPPPTEGPGMEHPGMVEVLAPIDDVELRIAESFPPQYFVGIKSGLSNSCVRFGRYEVQREDKTIRITLYNREPAGNVICLHEYRTQETNVGLGSDFQAPSTVIWGSKPITRMINAMGVMIP